MSNVPPIDLLRRQIKRVEQELVFAKETGAAKDDFAVLFTGNWHDSIPRNLIVNNNLSPVDKLCWQVLRLTISSPQQPGTAPTRDELALMVNCSAPTITTARQMLRLCRFMTFCSVVRHKGKFLGEVYLLHEEPLSIEDTLTLDPTYLEFCSALAKSGNKSSRLRKEAGLVLREVDRTETQQPPKTKAEHIGERIEHAMDFYGLDESTRAEPSIQSKNFALDGFLSESFEIQTDNLKTVEFNQRKNFAPDQNLTKSNQSKNFALASKGVFCSGSWRSSINNKVIKTRTHARAISEATAADVNDWIENLPDKQDYTSDQLPRYTERGDPKPENKPGWMLSDVEIEQLETGVEPISPLESREFEFQSSKIEALPEPSHAQRSAVRKYQSIDPDNAYDSGGFQAQLDYFFPEISDPVLSRYSSIGFFGIQPQMPVIARAIGGLEPLERRDILLQYMARKAAYVHGWHHEDVSNPIGYIRTLCTRIKKGEFIPDSFCGELIRSLHDKTPPMICDTHEIRAKKQEIENYGTEFERWKQLHN